MSAPAPPTRSAAELLEACRRRNARWAAFAVRLAAGEDQTAAYRAAGFTATGHSATSNASKLAREPMVAELVAALCREAEATAAADRATSDQAVVDQLGDVVRRKALVLEDLLEELAILGQSSVEHYEIDEAGTVKLAAGAPPHAMRAVSSIKRKVRSTDDGTEVTTELRLWGKPETLRMVGDHLGAWKPRGVKLEGELTMGRDEAAQRLMRVLTTALARMGAGEAPT